MSDVAGEQEPFVPDACIVKCTSPEWCGGHGCAKANVVEFPGTTVGDISVSRVLTGAQDANLATVIVIGTTEDGEPYYASSTGDATAMLWDVEKFKIDLLRE